MEERIIDDEYGRGVRLKKTKDGYVDVTEDWQAESVDEEGEEVTFEFPMMDDEDDEDLVGLSPEEAMALRKKKAEEREQRRADYERLCKEGEELLATGGYNAAELKYEKALELDAVATEASVGYWRAKTSNFTNPDVLVDEYVDEGIESLEYDLGIQATDIIRRDFHEVFKAQTAKLEEEETPLAERVEGKQAERRAIIRKRVKKGTIILLSALIPFVALLVLTAVFGLKITSTPDGRYILPTAICGGLAFVAFIITTACLNTFLNAMRMRRKNEYLGSTEDGGRLMEIRARKVLYEYLATLPAYEEKA